RAAAPGVVERPAVVDGSSVATASGTPGYMAPEQCAGKAIDARVDIFSLGVIIHELVTGQRLFRGRTIGAIVSETLRGAPMPGGGAWARAPERLRDHTTRMLAREPDARFADGNSVLAALRELTTDMIRHRSLLPAATAQAISNAPTLNARALVHQQSGKQRRIVKQVAGACAAAGVAYGVYAFFSPPPDVPISVSTPPRMVVI